MRDGASRRLGAVVFAVLIGLRVLAIREGAKGNTRFVGVFFVPVLLGGVVMTLAGLGMVSKNAFPGVVLLVIGVITTALVARMIVRAPSMAQESSVTGDIPGPMLDYVIWAAIGRPDALRRAPAHPVDHGRTPVEALIEPGTAPCPSVHTTRSSAVIARAA